MAIIEEIIKVEIIIVKIKLKLVIIIIFKNKSKINSSIINNSRDVSINKEGINNNNSR